MIYKLTSALLKTATEILCRIDAPDLHKIPDRGPLIVISNHTGQLEVAVFFGQLQLDRSPVGQRWKRGTMPFSDGYLILGK